MRCAGLILTQLHLATLPQTVFLSLPRADCWALLAMNRTSLMLPPLLGCLPQVQFLRFLGELGFGLPKAIHNTPSKLDVIKLGSATCLDKF